MQFPFRRPPDRAWHTRLPQLERGASTPAPATATLPPPEPGGLALTLTDRPPSAPVAVRDIVADPASAERLPSRALVQAVMAADTENRALRRRLHARKRDLAELRQAMADHAAEDGELRGRLRTLEEVIAALHANIEDLRLQRDQLLAR